MAANHDQLVGRQVKLVFTDDECTRLRPGAEGTIDLVDDLGTILVAWDDGSSLGLVPGRDRWLEVPPGSMFEEKEA